MHPKSPQFFESILFFKGEFPFLNLHLERILELADYLNLEFPLKINELETHLKTLVHGIDEQKLRIKFKWKSRILEIDAIESFFTHPHTFQNYPPISLVVYPHYAKPLDEFSCWKYENPPIYKDSMIYAEERHAAQSMILNENDEVIETSLSNFFYYLKDTLYTPPLSSGAVNGVFRRYLMSRSDIKERVLNLSELSQIQECFITSAVRGIVPVKEIDGQTKSISKVEFLINQSKRFNF